MTKTNYYQNIVANLKTSNPGKWYSKIKRLSNRENFKSESTFVEELDGLEKLQQSEAIANQFSKVSQEYDKINTEALKLNTENPTKPMPQISPEELYEILDKIKTNKSTIINDIPAKIIKEFAVDLAEPLSFLINNIMRNGQYPKLYKFERVTPVPNCLLYTSDAADE